MDSNEEPKSNEEEAAEDTSRQRYFGESSLSGEENTETNRSWRSSSTFVIPGVPASPPKFVTLEEIMSAANCMNNMALAHEIAVDKDFKLVRLEPSDNSFHKIVKDTVHKAFWDLLEEDLHEDPPDYSRALGLLEEIKAGLLAILLPQHTKMKQNILEVLDTKLIEQQVKAGTLNFKEYARYVISVMGKMCAPARDEKINELREMSDVVQTFRGILEVLDLMKLDMANFTIQLIRPDIIASSVEYEKAKFKEFLKTQQGGLHITRQWLLKHLPEGNYEGITVEEVKKLTEKALAHAYLELLEWAPGERYPETIVLDEARFRELAVRVFRSSIIGAIMLLISSYITALQGVASFRETVIKHLTALVADINTSGDLMKAITAIAVQVVKDVNDSLKAHGHPEVDDVTKNLLTMQVKGVSEPDHRIRDLVCKRLKEFLLSTITSPTAAPVRIPPGLSCLRIELTAITGNFLRLVSYNRAVFSEYYLDIVAATVPK